MLYADDTCIIVSRSPHGLAKMVEVIVEVCRAFGLNRASEEDRDHAYAPLTAYTVDDGASRRNRANIQTSAILHLPRGRRDRPDMPVEIARRTRACWMRIRLYLRELYDQPKVALSLKTRMVKPEVIEAPLYEYSTWTPPPPGTLCRNLRTVHHRVLLRIIGAQRKRPDHRMTSYDRALEITRCKNIETTLRTRDQTTD